MATRPPQHSISDRGESALTLALDPWPVNFFRRDYGIDGEVKLAKRELSEFNPTILPWSFEFQLKSGEWSPGCDPSVTVKTDHMEYWLRHNVPTVLFRVLTDQGAVHRDVYWRLIDKIFYRWLVLERTKWRENQTVSITFGSGDLLVDGSLEALSDGIRSWERPCPPESP